MNNVSITQEFTMECAHTLPWHSGKCKNLHGHRYVLHVSLKGPLNENGVVMNFEDIEEVVNKKVIDTLDHQYLNDIIDNPTAENIVVWIWDALRDSLPSLKELKLWETTGSYVSYSGN